MQMIYDNYGSDGRNKAPKFPVRVVLNNRTISIFASASMDSVYKSYDLRYLVLKKVVGDDVDANLCFNMVD